MSKIKPLRKFIFILPLLLFSKLAFADHVFGGYIGFKTLDVEKGRYQLNLTQYIDAKNLRLAAKYDLEKRASFIHVYRKRDNQFIEKFFTIFVSTRTLIFDNVACATQRNFDIIQYTQSYEIEIDAQKYDAPEGYYLTFERCCRNVDIDNIEKPGEVGMIFYTEIPPLFVNGKAVDYSTPEFPSFNGDYICLGRNFNYDFSAKDKDGDELKYKLGVPQIGRSTLANPVPPPLPKPYSSVAWLPGYSDAIQISGTPNLSINAATGILNVKANKEGLFVFSIECEDFRDGKRMGMVKHDFQLPVVKCNFVTPPVPVVKYNGAISPQIDFCPGDGVLLETENNINWAFQWQKDGKNIPNATSNTYLAKEKANYQVVKSLKGICANDTISNLTKIKPAVEMPKIEAKSLNICGSNTVTLKLSNANSAFRYSWSNSQNQIGSGDSIKVDKLGWYYVLGDKPTGNCKSELDSVEVTQTITNPLPIPKPKYEACIGESLKIETIKGASYTYQWKKDNVDLNSETKDALIVKNNGTYTVDVKDQNGCTGTSKSYAVIFTIEPTIVFDSIGPLCKSGGNTAVLYAFPTSGVFTGPGVNANVFDPEIAGIGMHEVLYKYSSPSGCKGTSKRTIEVTKPFEFNVTPNITTINAGDSLALQAISPEANLEVHWHPDTYLKDHSSQSQIIKPAKSITYVVSAIGPDGCKVKNTVSITVIDFVKFFMPSGFTPNNDSKNDLLEYYGEEIQDLKLKIYDRWGELIFESEDKTILWNGNYNNNVSKPLPTGLYTYIIEVENLKGMKLKKKGAISLLK